MNEKTNSEVDKKNIDATEENNENMYPKYSNILFRARTELIVGTYNNGKEDGEWVEGYLRCDCGKWIIYQFEVDRADQVAYEVNPNTICRYTGLTDYDGNKVWENDIIRVFDMTSDDYIAKWSDEKGAFVIASAVTQVVFVDLLSDVFDESVVVCVIGNIFDNPELLEV